MFANDIHRPSLKFKLWLSIIILIVWTIVVLDSAIEKDWPSLVYCLFSWVAHYLIFYSWWSDFKTQLKCSRNRKIRKINKYEQSKKALVIKVAKAMTLPLLVLKKYLKSKKENSNNFLQNNVAWIFLFFWNKPLFHKHLKIIR